MSSCVLIVDDEPDVLELCEFNLKAAGCKVLKAADGEEALRQVQTGTVALVVLDLMLPKIDGLEVCKALRRNPATARLPIIMLTAKADEIDRVLGLELGADDYLTKPFSPRELVLRVKGLLRRSVTPTEEPEMELRYPGLVIDVPKHEVRVQNKRIELTATEFRLITLLAQRAGRVQSRDRLLTDVWGYERAIDTRTVDTHMRRLRDKLGSAAKYLDTVRGAGYRFAVE